MGIKNKGRGLTSTARWERGKASDDGARALLKRGFESQAQKHRAVSKRGPASEPRAATAETAGSPPPRGESKGKRKRRAAKVKAAGSQAPRGE